MCKDTANLRWKCFPEWNLISRLCSISDFYGEFMKMNTNLGGMCFPASGAVVEGCCVSWVCSQQVMMSISPLPCLSKSWSELLSRVENKDGYGDVLCASGFLVRKKAGLCLCTGRKVPRDHTPDCHMLADPSAHTSPVSHSSCRGMDVIQEHHPSFKDLWLSSKPEGVAELLSAKHGEGSMSYYSQHTRCFQRPFSPSCSAGASMQDAALPGDIA